MIETENGTDVETIREVAKRVEAKVEKSGLTVYSTWIPTPGTHPASDSIQPIILVMGFVGMLSLFLSGFLVINTISALLAQQKRQIGIMKIVGARAPQIMGLYLGMVIVFGVLSLGIALPLGDMAARALTGYMADLVNFDVADYRAPTSVLAVEVSIGLITPLIAALYPILAGTRTTVQQALSDYALPPRAARQGFLARVLARLWVLPRPLMLSLRNTFRRKGRLILTLATLSLAGAIFIAVFSVRASLLLTLDDALRYWGEDATVQFSRAYRTELLEREARTIPGVVSAETWDFASARWQRPDGTESDTLTLVGAPNPSHMIDPIMVEGRWLLPEDENAIVINSIILKDDPSIRVGDDITLTINERDATWRVVGIAKGLATGRTAYANRDYLGFSQGRVGRAYSVRVTTVLHDRETQDRVARALEDHFESIGVRVRSRSIIADTRDTIEYQFNIVIVLLLIMAVLLAVVGGLGLMGTMSINVIERTREVGVMRAIGASDGAVLRIIITEGMLIGGISWVLGSLLGVPLSQGLSTSLGEALFRSSMSTAFSVGGVLLWLGLVLGLSALASFLPARNASRLTVREVLAYE
jgi:putative ABC transport system permease protein